HPVLDGGPATCTGAVAGDERLGRRQLRVVKTRSLIRTVEKRQQLPLNLNCWHIRSSRWTGQEALHHHCCSADCIGPPYQSLFESDPMRTLFDCTAFLCFEHLLGHPVEFLEDDRLAAH